MTDIKFEIINFPYSEQKENIDIICIEHLDHLTEIVSNSVVFITIKESKIKIRFDWKENINEIVLQDFLFIPETNILFFKSINQWGAIDLIEKKIKRHENSTWLPLIQRKNNYILIEDDLNAESTLLNGDKIDSVPIDPPTESKEFEDKIEYNSPVFGYQILKTKLMK